MPAPYRRFGEDEKMKVSVDQACPFCGQFIAIKIDEDMMEQEREEIARKNAGARRQYAPEGSQKRWTSWSRSAA